MGGWRRLRNEGFEEDEAGSSNPDNNFNWSNFPTITSGNLSAFSD
jgi:hypothetical protein